MKILTWNCNMAFRKKAHLLSQFSADIVVVPECEHPDKLQFEGDAPAPTSSVWYGQNQNKGLGVFSFNGYGLKLLPVHNPAFRNILPIKVTRAKETFTLFAVWANNPDDRDGVYVTQVWKAIHFYEKLLKSTKTILVGDFNSNTIWDKPKREGNHSTVVSKLELKGIFSAYHRFYGHEQGKELHPTLFMYRHEDKPYHIDYCFASADFIDRLKNVEVGHFKDWSQFSDHKPLVATFGE
ncbi:MAG TPA: endonuclease/exonuclease/phosphatase family protein [Bacteroidia bacterium]|nr:endonuclease/exonuclease/phosphatase family protein [Bacteroidia bacterium]